MTDAPPIVLQGWRKEAKLKVKLKAKLRRKKVKA